MSISLKPGVQFTVIAPAGFLILQALKAASARLGITLTITSACDGEHSGLEDPHHKGEAYDIRTHDFLPIVKQNVLDAIMAELDTSQFFGFLEAPGTANEHLHIQQRKGVEFTVKEFLASPARTV